MAGTLSVTTHDNSGDLRKTVIHAVGDATDGSFPATRLSALTGGGRIVDLSGAWVAISTDPVVAATTITLATSAASDDIIDTAAPHGFVAGTAVRFKTLTGGTGLTAVATYYVVATSLGAQTFRVAETSGGAAINFTTDITAGTVTSDFEDAPDDNWDITLVDEDGLDRLGGLAANRDVSTSERTALSGVYVARGEDPIFTIAGNTVKYGAADITLTVIPSGVSASSITSTGGDASEANQDEQTALLTTIDSDTSIIQASTAVIDAAVTVSGGGAARGVLHVGVRDDALAALTPVEGDAVPLLLDANGALWVQLAGALSASVDTIAVGAKATDGCDAFYSIDLDESEEDVKVTAGTVYGWHIVNRDTAPVYIRFYNATAANVTVGSTAAHFVIEVPYTAAGHVGAVAVFPPGIKFGTAISVAATTGIADNDTSAPGANDVMATIFFK